MATEKIVAGADFGARGKAATNLYRVVETDERVSEPFGNHVFRFMAVRHKRRMPTGNLSSYHLRVEKIGRRWMLVPYQNVLKHVDLESP